MIINLHTHTARCGHAVGSDREYIESAIKSGIKVLGFSDHAPFIFPDGHESNFRIKSKEKFDYISSLNSLREEYKNDIEIKIGFEMEYYPSFFDQMLKNVKELSGEYLLLGQHFVTDETVENSYSATATDDTEKLKLYVDNVIKGVKTGVFTYVCHPDVIRFTGSYSDYEKEISRLLTVLNEYDIPVEVNFLGIRGKRHYPNKLFWELAGKFNSKTVYGLDAHDPQCILDFDESMKIAEEFRNKYNLNVIEDIKIKNL